MSQKVEFCKGCYYSASSNSWAAPLVLKSSFVSKEFRSTSMM